MHPLRLAVLLVCAATPLSAQVPTEVRAYDVGGLLDCLRGDQTVSFRLPLRASVLSRGESWSNAASPEEVEPVGDAGWIESIVHTMLFTLQRVDEQQDFSLHIDGDALWFVGPAEWHERLERFLADLESAFLRTAEVRLDVLPAEAIADAGGAVIAPHDVAALLRDHPPVASARGTVHVGRSGILAAKRLTSFVADYDVEVAKKRSASDPIVAPLLEGLEARVAVHATPDERLFVTLEGRAAAQDGEPRSVATSADVGRVRLPSTQSVLLAASGVLENGGALLAGCDTGGGCWLLRVEAQRERQASVEILPVAAWTTPGLAHHAPDVLAPTASGVGEGGFGLFDEAEEPRASMSEDRLVDMVQSMNDGFEGAIDLMAGRLTIQPGGESAEATAGVAASARRLLGTAWLGELARIHTVELRWGFVDAVPEATAAQLSERLPRRALLSGRPQDLMTLVAGRESAYLKDLDVEIAEESSITDPVIDALFDGLALHCRVRPTRSGALHFSGDAVVQSVVGSARHDPSVAALSDIETPASVHVARRLRLVVEDGEWSHLMTAPLPGGDRHVVAVVRVTR